jgi:hypothetical protein
MKSKVKIMPIIFFDIKGNVHKEFVLEGQTINFAYYCDVLRRLSENMRRLLAEFWRQKNWLLHHDNIPPHTSLLPREFLTKSNMIVVPQPSYFSVFPIEDKTEKPPF